MDMGPHAEVWRMMTASAWVAVDVRLYYIGEAATILESGLLSVKQEKAAFALSLQEDDVQEGPGAEFLRQSEVTLREAGAVLRPSLLIATFSEVETFLRHLCLVEAMRLQLPYEPDRSSWWTIEATKKFLKQRAGFKFPDAKPEWQDVKRLQELRNIFAHAGGLVPKLQEGLEEYITRSPGLTVQKLSKGTRIVVSVDYVRHANDLARRFCRLVCAASPVGVNVSGSGTQTKDG